MTEPTTPDSPTSACVPNIGSRECTKRWVAGAVLLAVSVAILAALLSAGASRWWRLLLLLPFWASGIGLFQARERT